MSNGKSILVGAVLIAVAILLHGYWPRYTLAAADPHAAWRIETNSGRISYCGLPGTGPFEILRNGFKAPGAQPQCTIWSE